MQAKHYVQEHHSVALWTQNKDCERVIGNKHIKVACFPRNCYVCEIYVDTFGFVALYWTAHRHVGDRVL